MTLLALALVTESNVWRVVERHHGPFPHRESLMHVVSLGNSIPWKGALQTGGDTPANSTRSTLTLRVNGRKLGPPHMLHEKIRRSGGGAYSHWHDNLFFSLPAGLQDGQGIELQAEYSPRLKPLAWSCVIGLFVTAGVAMAAVLRKEIGAFRLPTPGRPLKGVLTVLVGLTIILCAYARLASLHNVDPVLVPDSSAFLSMANAPLSSQTMWLGLRAPVVPLVYKALHGDHKRIVAVQRAFGAFAWAILMLVAASVTRTWRGRLAAVFLLGGFSLTHQIVQWDAQLWAESISFSLMALTVASTIALLRWWRPWLVALVFGLCAAWCFSRDADTFTVGALSGAGLLAAVLTRSARRRWAPLAVALMVMAGLAHLWAIEAARWKFPYINVLAQRILTSPERLTYFADRGLPVDPALVAMGGKWASSDNGAFYHDPRLANFREWLHTHGRSVYLSYLTSHPRYLFAAPLSDLRRVVSPDLRSLQPAGMTQPAGRLTDFLMPINQTWTPLLALAMLLVVAALGRRAPAALAIPGALLVIVSPPIAWLVWHADAMEVARHSLPASMLGHLGMWLLVIATIDSEPPRTPRAGGSSITAGAGA